MNKYPKIRLGKYRGSYINEVPISYLMWLLPTLTQNHNNFHLYYGILTLFFLENIKVEEYDSKIHFYFKDYDFITPPDIPKPFLICECCGLNSIGEKIYEVVFFDMRFYIVENGNNYEISDKYVSHKYLYGGLTMVYEKNKTYYFIDPFGTIIFGAYLIRKPYISDKSLINKFSENIKYEETTII